MLRRQYIRAVWSIEGIGRRVLTTSRAHVIDEKDLTEASGGVKASTLVPNKFKKMSMKYSQMQSNDKEGRTATEDGEQYKETETVTRVHRPTELSRKRYSMQTMDAVDIPPDNDVLQAAAPLASVGIVVEEESNSNQMESDEQIEEEGTAIETSEEPEEAEQEPVDITDVCIVSTVEEARRVMCRLHEIVERDPDVIFACDTEVKEIDVTKQSPRGHGSVTCFSVYCGGAANFIGENEVETHLWVDTLGKDGQEGEAKEVMDVFKDFFEDAKFRKVWHNYGFDRHVMTRMGIRCKGFCGDTMHMARLLDSSRKGKGYSLEALSTDEEFKEKGSGSEKTSMKELFGKPKLKRDGTPGRVKIIPPVDEIQLSPDLNTQTKWIHYSVRDAKATYDLYQTLRTRLSREETSMDEAVQRCYPDVHTLWDFYCHVWQPFGDLLTEMEDNGFYVNEDHLIKAQAQAEEDKDKALQYFLAWAERYNAGHMNPSSDAQIRTLLFAGVQKKKKSEDRVPLTRIIKVPNPEYDKHKEEKRKGRAPKRMVDLTLKGLWVTERPPREESSPETENETLQDEAAETQPEAKHDIPLEERYDVHCPLKPEIYTAAGWPAVSAAALKVLIGTPGAARSLLEERYNNEVTKSISELPSPLEEEEPENEIGPLDEAETTPTDDEIEYIKSYDAVRNGLGRLYSAFEDPKEGLEASVAVECLVEISAIETLLSAFIIPLQGDAIKTREDGRIHCSMNINTETGRLSCRRPNLQNQPALEKDRYKVRQSFTATKGNKLIVADYGQLELRILGHLTRCQSMLKAFKSGGDFHSRTAVGMYDHIQAEIAAGKVALEKGTEEQDIPLVKDVYTSERRKAKILNFSLAYGKTAHGLSKDWKVSLKEAEETLDRWYSDRVEVKEWQTRTIERAKKVGYVTTLLGRRRNLPEIGSRNHKFRSHAARAAINTPIQGSAADIATAAMLAIQNNERLGELGWKLLSQVHDEVILEGPEESVEEAQKLVVACMERPFPSPNGGYENPLDVELSVDCKYADNWYDAK